MSDSRGHTLDLANEVVANWSQKLASHMQPFSYGYDQAMGSADLSGSGAWLQSIADEVTDYIYLKDRRSRFVFANAVIAHDFGLKTSSDLTGKCDHDLLSDQFASRFLDDEREILETGQARVDCEEYVEFSTGVKKWLSTSKFPLKTPEGEIVGILGLARDITERKKLEMLRVGQTRVLEMIAKGAREREVLEGIVYLIEEQLDGVLGSILLLDKEGQHLVSGASPSLPTHYNLAIDGISVGPDVGSCGTAAYCKKSVVVSNIAEDPLWSEFRDLALEAGLKSCWSTPFFSKTGAILGTFALYNRKIGEPTETETRLVEEATRLASIAIERLRADREINYLARHDALTGLPNRLEFKSVLDLQLDHCLRKNKQLALIFVDLDQFKVVNDSFGHSIGDDVLKIIADRLRTLAHPDDAVFRFGGDEFVILLAHERVGKDDIIPFLVELRRRLSEAIVIHGRTFHVTASIGVACFPEDGNVGELLISHADNAMYKAKDAGRDVFKFYTPAMSRGVAQRLTLLEEMRVGLETGEFRLDYQPQIDMESGALLGTEALVRWDHPYMGTLMPGRFIPLMEDTDLICQLGTWVLNEACRQAEDWQQKYALDVVVGVNVSARQFGDDRFVEVVRSALSESGLRPDLLELEITESLLFRNKAQAARIMNELRLLGVQLAIDDFGTGFSSLSTLRSFPLTRLKIDRSFISDLDRENGDSCISRAVVSLGKDLGLRVIAEGVETKRQKELLLEMGCREAQGYFLGRPKRPQEIEANMKDGFDKSLVQWA